MQTLDRKLFRDLWRLWAQSLAIGLVLACGVAILVVMYGAERSLSETQETFYERNRFADIFASATRVPNDVLGEITAIPGVSQAETRISQHAILDIDGLEEPAMGRLLSLPEFGEPRLNVPSLTEGRWPDKDKPYEVVVNQNFFAANEFALGDTFEVTLNGRKQPVTIVGTALSPEFIYTIGPGALMPDDVRFGIIWMNYQTLAGTFRLQGAFNDLTVKTALGADQEEILDRVEDILAPYGGTGPYLREFQTSHSFIAAELESLRTMARVLPPLFFVISAFLVGMVLGRLIALEREQIGLFKAVGYSNAAISWHYVKLAIGIGAFGILLGWGVGAWGGHGLSAVYAQYFHFPYLIYISGWDTFIISGLAGIATVVIGAVRPVLRTTRLSPAVAMSPPAPTRYREGWIDWIGRVLRVRQPTMMIIRSITRWPIRAGLTAFGIAMAAATMVSSLFMFDAMDELVESAFFQANRQEATLSFIIPQGLEVTADVENLPGVMRAEGMRTVAARLSHGHLSRLSAIEGRLPGQDLSRVLDAESDEVIFPEQGIVLSNRLSGHLDARVGDVITVEILEGQRGTYEVPVTGVITQYFGLGAYMDISALSAMLQQTELVNSVHVALDDAQISELYAAVKAAPNVAGMVLWTQIRKAFYDTIAESSGISTTVYALVASLIVIGVVYNSARIQLSERGRELASLRILGFTKAEVSYILLGELIFLTLVAIPMGWFLGRTMAFGIVTSFSSDLYSIPLIISQNTYAMTALVVLGASVGSALLVRRRINRLDLIAVMKTRE